MTIEQFVERIIEEYPIYQWGIINTDKIVFHPEVREICEKNACGCYGKTWTCPPAYGTYEECRKMCLSYKKAFVFTGKYDLEDSYDFEGMMTAKEQFQNMVIEIRKSWEEAFGQCHIYGNGSCASCETCTYPDAPCRFPQKAVQSLEGLGILVNRLAESVGINYINGKNTVTYFSAVFYSI